MHSFHALELIAIAARELPAEPTPARGQIRDRDALSSLERAIAGDRRSTRAGGLWPWSRRAPRARMPAR